MLTADLLRASIRNDRIKPRLIDPNDEALREIAARLVSAFEANIGQTRSALDDEIADVVGDETQFAISRGFAKLLDDRSKWDTAAPVPPVELRRHVFEASAAAHPIGERRGVLHRASRADVLADVAERLGLTVQQVEDGLYADLKSEQRLISFRALSAEGLLHRYNLALAQGLLLRTSELEILVDVSRPSRLRQLYRALKFHQLMHRSRRADGGVRITVDGPMSLFGQSTRYGMQMANFLPTLLLTDRWTLHAQVNWQHAPRPLTLELSPDDGLVSHLKPRGTWVSDEEKMVVERIRSRDDAWEVVRRARVVDLAGKDVFVPDFVVRCADTGREALVEVVGYWRRAYLERRAALLAKHGPPNLVLCVSNKLCAGESSDLDGLEGRILPYAKVIPAKKLVDLVDEVALRP